MNSRHQAATVSLALLPTLFAQAQVPVTPVTLRYHFLPGQRLRYLIQRDPYFNDPMSAIETTNPNTSYRAPVVERLTEKVQAVGQDGTATVQLTVEAEPGFEDTASPVPAMTQTVRVTPLGQVLSPVEDSTMQDLLRAFFRLPAATVRSGETWKGKAFQETGQVETHPTLTATRGGSRGLAIITQVLPPMVRQSRSPDHDGTLLQTTRSAQADRVVFDLGSGSLRRQTSTMTITLSLVMTGRGARGAADFGHVIPNVQVVQTMTMDRQDDPPGPTTPDASSPMPGGLRPRG